MRIFGLARVVAAIGSLLPLLYHRGAMKTASAEVSVDMDPDTALEDIAHALLILDENGRVTLDAGSSSAWLDTPWSWKSVGERVTAEFDGRVIRVTSQSRNPALVDYGKNEENVEAVIAALERIQGRQTPSE